MTITAKPRSFFVDQKCVPWGGFRQYAQRMETLSRLRTPALYRLLRFGRILEIVTAVLRGPKHQFIGYFDETPCNLSDWLLLTHEGVFNQRSPAAGGIVVITVVNNVHGNSRTGIA